MVQKKNVYLGEFNLLMNGSTYLPLVSGLLRAHAETSEVVQEHFRFAPFLFHIDRLDRIVDRYERPAVATFSSLMWNAQLSLATAREVKRRHPDCLIVFGGANVPHEAEGFFAEHPFIDVTVRGEGETPFTQVLERLAAAEDPRSLDLDGVPGVSWRAPNGEYRSCQSDQPFVRDLDAYPSPYLEGLFDPLVADHPEFGFQAIIETNRGCPFQCTFCYWGKGGMSRKYRFHGVDRVKRELEWMADNGIRYVFNADSNFGMHRRDREIAEFLVELKQRTGYPHKFRTCYGKNTDEKIFEIGKLFHDHGLEKGITISYQSVDEEVQANIKRANIKLSSARELQQKFNDSGVPVYTELILGLPGESYASWIAGVDRVLGSNLKNQLFMYLCQVFPNTDLAAPEYLEAFGIETQIIELTEIHGLIRTDDWVREEEEIVIATATMPAEDWRRAVLFSWMTMTMHSLKLGYFVMGWLVDRFGIRHSEFLEHLSEGRFDHERAPLIAAQLAVFEQKVAALRNGEGRGCLLEGYGRIYWDEEEACFLRLSQDFERYFDELRELTRDFLEARGATFDPVELDDVIAYQSASIPRPGPTDPRLPQAGIERHGDEVAKVLTFEHNLGTYFAARFGSNPIPLERGREQVRFRQPDFAHDLDRFARESILWGRKSGTMLAQTQIIGANAVEVG